MKHVFTLVLFLQGLQLSAQQHQLNFYIPVDVPFKAEMPYMSTNVGVGMSYAYRPMVNFPMYLELKGSLGSYASQTLNQTFQFGNGNTTETSVSYTSSLNKTLLGSKFIISNDFRPLRIYLTPQAGIAAMRSKIYVADPQDEDDCHPLEKRTVQRDLGFVYGGEIGFQLDLQRLIKCVSVENRSHLNVSFSFLTSPEMYDYVNVKHMQDGHLDDHSGADGSRDLTSKFINVTSNSIHEHKIAEVYRTKFQVWGINVGYTLTF